LTSTKKVPLLAPLFLFQRIKGHIAIQVLTEVSLQWISMRSTLMNLYLRKRMK